MRPSSVFLADLLIGMAYFAIPIALLFVARPSRSIWARRFLWLFATFILLCGSTHFVDAWYELQGVCSSGKLLQKLMKWATAMASIGTVATIIPKMKIVLFAMEREIRRQGKEDA